VSGARANSAPGNSGSAGAPRAICAPRDRAAPGEGEEYLRRVLEDLVIARQRDPNKRAGVSVADLAEDLGVSRQHVQRLLSADEPGVNLRAGQLLALRPRVRAQVMAALSARSEELGASPSPPEHDALLRRMAILCGRLAETLDRARADGRVDEEEQAQLRAMWAELAAEAQRGAVE